ncbi:MAG: (2Fe-2S)-binding protein [Acetobacteraceae bacterium]
MYICLCNALTDRQITQAVADQGAARPSDVYEICGCRAKCGQCVKAILGMLQEVSTPSPGFSPAVD